MASFRLIQRCVFLISASTLVVLVACGGGGEPGDVLGDADAAVTGDVIGQDTDSDALGRDTSDVLATDVEGDSSVGSDANGDVPTDIPVDVGRDIIGEVDGDVTCVPDCSGGPCSDDGCGGDCCDGSNVCGKNFDGTATVCLPVDGTTCAQVGACSSACSDQACGAACYDAGSAQARDAIWAATDCVKALCPEITQQCVTAAYSEGGACFGEYQACMNDCAPDCSGGPCTDDGCGGDCCAAPNVCQPPESGEGLECLPPPEKTCLQIWACAIECPDADCAQACINSGSAEGQAQLNDLIVCLNDACSDPTEECLNAATESGGACYTEAVACT